MTNKQKGFTLIELLIVIAIIGILAVAFLPSLLGAPAKGRDAARISDLQKIQKVLISGDLVGTKYPDTGCVDAAVFPDASEFGGALPVDPAENELTVEGKKCTGQYVYIKQPAAKAYSFGIYAKMETAAAGNSKCSELDAVGAGATLNKSDDDSDSCYAILLK